MSSHPVHSNLNGVRQRRPERDRDRDRETDTDRQTDRDRERQAKIDRQAGRENSETLFSKDCSLGYLDLVV